MCRVKPSPPKIWANQSINHGSRGKGKGGRTKSRPTTDCGGWRVDDKKTRRPYSWGWVCTLFILGTRTMKRNHCPLQQYTTIEQGTSIGMCVCVCVEVLLLCLCDLRINYSRDGTLNPPPPTTTREEGEEQDWIIHHGGHTAPS